VHFLSYLRVKTGEKNRPRNISSQCNFSHWFFPRYCFEVKRNISQYQSSSLPLALCSPLTVKHFPPPRRWSFPLFFDSLLPNFRMRHPKRDLFPLSRLSSCFFSPSFTKVRVFLVFLRLRRYVVHSTPSRESRHLWQFHPTHCSRSVTPFFYPFSHFPFPASFVYK